MEQENKTCTAFVGQEMVAAGPLMQVAANLRNLLKQDSQLQVLVFDDTTAEPIELDLRDAEPGDQAGMALQEQKPQPGNSIRERGRPLRRGPGRPKLGVVAKEVTLLPRHWQWLQEQPGGASVTLRKLVEAACKQDAEPAAIRRSQEAAFRFMQAVAGDLQGFEEAIRALFAGDPLSFEQQVQPWPHDVRDYARRLAKVALERGSSGGAVR